MRPRTLTVGNVDPTCTLLEGLSFPILEDVGAAPELMVALRHAADFRRAVVVSGRKGAGKTLGLGQAVRDFRKDEAVRARNDVNLPERGVALIPPRRPSSRSELIRLLYEQEFGDIGMRNIRLGDEAMLAELVQSWTEAGVAVVVFDEAENLPAKTLTVCRDIISYSVPSAEDLLADEPDRYRRTGLGVVLVGTPVVPTRLRKTPEWGERWTRVVEVEEFEPELLPDVYAAYLPAFAREAERRGSKEWARFVLSTVGAYHTGSLRLVETHVDCYLALYADNAEVPPRSVDEVEFDEEIFLGAMADMAITKLESAAA